MRASLCFVLFVFFNMCYPHSYASYMNLAIFLTMSALHTKHTVGMHTFPP